MAAAIPTEWEVVPGVAGSAKADLQAIAQRCRRKVTKNALFAAGVAVVPVPGIDWLTDLGVLIRLLPQINAEFGLTPEQIERLAPERRIVVYKAISAGSGLLVGRVVTQDLVLRLIRLVGVRLTTQQAAKFVPLAGQAVSAALTFTALKFVCEQHIRQCLAVARQLQQLPAPGPSRAPS
jgi:hypothetical protein